MKKHLEHYGYFTGRNMAIARFGFEPKRKSISKNENESNESDTCSEDSDENSTNKLIKSKLFRFIRKKTYLVKVLQT